MKIDDRVRHRVPAVAAGATERLAAGVAGGGPRAQRMQGNGARAILDRVAIAAVTLATCSVQAEGAGQVLASLQPTSG